MMVHTREPWKIGYGELDGGYLGIFADNEHDVVARISPKNKENEQDMANARRIVACVNACAGIETETLEAPGSIADIIHAHRDNEACLRSALAEKTDQVDRLREVLEDVSSQIHFLKMGICAGDSSKELEIRCADILKLAREALAATAHYTPGDRGLHGKG